MAWWIDVLFFKHTLEGIREEKDGGPALVSLGRALKRIFYDNFVDTLHISITIASYGYFGASVVIFFFQKDLPESFSYVIATFSEPYLGALGIAIVVSEIRRRAGKSARTFGTYFIGAWLTFLIVATLVVYFDQAYYFNTIYRTIVTNSLAALIIRIGSMLR